MTMHESLPVARTATRVVIALLVLVLLSGDALARKRREPYVGYPGPVRADEELATLRLEEADWVTFGDERVHRALHREIKLLPGSYPLRWGCTFGVSFLVNPQMKDRREYGTTVTLEANHTYTLHVDRTYGRGYRVFFWIEDRATGEIIAGVKKPSRK